MLTRLPTLLLLVCSLAPCVAAQAGFCPPDSPQSDGMRDIMLIYEGGKPWTPQEFAPYAAYIDRQGNPRDWFYDAFLFLMYGGAPSGATYIDGKSNRGDWEHFLNVTFATNRCLGGLDRAIESLAGRLPGPRTCPVILMIPYPSPEQKEFGDVDGDGASEDLSTDAARVKAVRWFVDEALARWAKLAPRHLKLWGFYLMNEGIGGRDEAIGRATAEVVHARGCKLHWIPWFRAPGLARWRDLGIDLAIVQPNYAFTRPDRGFNLPNEDRLTQNATDARSLGLGVEMETPFAFPEDPAARWVFRQYLNHGADELDGYMRGAVRAYYQGSDVIARCATSDLPHVRAFYDDLYRFHKGTYTRQRTSLAEGAACSLLGAGKPLPTRRLTDGLWLTRSDQEGRLVALRGGRAVVTVDLGSPTLVDDVRVHLAARKAGEMPTVLRVSTAPATGGPFEPRGETYRMPGEPAGKWVAGFAAVHFEPVVARLVRLELSGAPSGTLRLDEVVIPPAAHLLWGSTYRLAGDVVPADANAWRLTEGMPGGPPVRWRRGPAEVSFSGDAMIGSQVRVRVRKRGASAPSLQVRLTPSGPWRHGAVSWQSATHAWLTLALDPEPFDHLTLRVAQAPPSSDGGYETRRSGPRRPGVLTDAERSGGYETRRSGPRRPGVLADAERRPSPAGRPAKLGAPRSMHGAGPSRVPGPPSSALAIEDVQVVPAPNLARHCPYTLDPGFPAQYPDGGGELTDGTLSEGFGDGRTVGWYGQSPSVTLDLGQVRAFDAVRAHVQGGGHAAVYAPTQMAVFLSRDGARWERAGVATERDPGTPGVQLHSWLMAAVPPASVSAGRRASGRWRRSPAGSSPPSPAGAPADDTHQEPPRSRHHPTGPSLASGISAWQPSPTPAAATRAPDSASLPNGARSSAPPACRA